MKRIQKIISCFVVAGSLTVSVPVHGATDEPLTLTRSAGVVAVPRRLPVLLEHVLASPDALVVSTLFEEQYELGQWLFENDISIEHIVTVGNVNVGLLEECRTLFLDHSQPRTPRLLPSPDGVASPTIWAH